MGKPSTNSGVETLDKYKIILVLAKNYQVCAATRREDLNTFWP